MAPVLTTRKAPARKVTEWDKLQDAAAVLDFYLGCGRCPVVSVYAGYGNGNVARELVVEELVYAADGPGQPCVELSGELDGERVTLRVYSAELLREAIGESVRFGGEEE